MNVVLLTDERHSILASDIRNHLMEAGYDVATLLLDAGPWVSITQDELNSWLSTQRSRIENLVGTIRGCNAIVWLVNHVEFQDTGIDRRIPETMAALGFAVGYGRPIYIYNALNRKLPAICWLIEAKIITSKATEIVLALSKATSEPSYEDLKTYASEGELQPERRAFVEAAVSQNPELADLVEAMRDPRIQAAAQRGLELGILRSAIIEKVKAADVERLESIKAEVDRLTSGPPTFTRTLGSNGVYKIEWSDGQVQWATGTFAENPTQVSMRVSVSKGAALDNVQLQARSALATLRKQWETRTLATEYDGTSLTLTEDVLKGCTYLRWQVEDDQLMYDFVTHLFQLSKDDEKTFLAMFSECMRHDIMEVFDLGGDTPKEELEWNDEFMLYVFDTLVKAIPVNTREEMLAWHDGAWNRISADCLDAILWLRGWPELKPFEGKNDMVPQCPICDSELMPSPDFTDCPECGWTEDDLAIDD